MIHLLYAIFYLLLVFSPLRKASFVYFRILLFISIIIHLFLPSFMLTYLYISLIIPSVLKILLKLSVEKQWDCMAFNICRLMNNWGFDRKRLLHLLTLKLDKSYKELPSLKFKTQEEFNVIKSLGEYNKSWQVFLDDYENLSADEKIAYLDIYTHAKEESAIQQLKCEKEL